MEVEENLIFLYEVFKRS